MLRIYHAYVESTFSRLICRNKGWVFKWRKILFYARAMKWTVLSWPTSLRTSELGVISIIFEQAIHRFSNLIWAVQCNFLTGILHLVYLCFAKMSKEGI